MRMRVLLGRASMRRPTRVPDPVVALKRIFADRFFKVPQLPFSAAQLHMMIAINHRNPSRVITAIFELTQALDYQRHDFLVSNVSDNSTHKAIFPNGKPGEPLPISLPRRGPCKRLREAYQHTRQ